MAKKRKHSTVEGSPMNMEHWEVEQDLQALGRASAVRKDPERMGKVREMAKEKLDENRRKKEESQAMISLGQSEDKT